MLRTVRIVPFNHWPRVKLKCGLQICGTSRGGRLVCSTVAACWERDDRCLSPRRVFSFAPIDPGSERSPFSSVSGLFDLAVGTICESPHTGSRTSCSRYDHHRCACTTWLPDRCCTAMLISARDWQKNTHLYAIDEHATLRIKWERWNMKRYKFKHPPLLHVGQRWDKHGLYRQSVDSSWQHSCHRKTYVTVGRPS